EGDILQRPTKPSGIQMMKSIPRFVLAAALIASPLTLSAQTDSAAPERTIRRDIPLTNMIRRALAAGTRDSTGRPGRNYWQLWTEYTINARLDAPSSTVTGRETVVLHNNSDTTLRNIVLRLDQNYFTPNAARSEPNPSAIEITSGMKL